MMQPGISSFAFGWAVEHGAFAPEALLDFAIAHGVSVIQFGDHVPLIRWESDALDALAGRARSAGVAIEVGARGLHPEGLQAHIALCRRLGARFLRFITDDRGYAPAGAEVVRILRDHERTLREAEIVLGIENHDRFHVATLRRLVDQVASDHIGICLDTANSLGVGEGIGEVLAQLAPVCVNLHVKDFAIERLPHLMGFTVTGRPLGEGMLPLNDVLEAVAVHGRCRTSVLETWPPPELDVAATLAKESDWAVRGIRTLRAALAAANDKPVRSSAI